MDRGDEELLAELDVAVRRVARAVTPAEAHDAVEEAAQAGHQAGHGPLAANVYLFWSGVADLYDFRRVTGVPEEGFLVVAQQLADQWLTTPAGLLDQLLGDTLGNPEFDVMDMVTRAGFTVRAPDPFREQPWRGHWTNVAWSIQSVDVTHSPYAATQRLLNDLRTEPLLWEVGQGDQLVALLRNWDQRPQERDRINDLLRSHLTSLTPDQIPPLHDPH